MILLFLLLNLVGSYIKMTLKKQIFNDYFQEQTILDDSNAVLLELSKLSYFNSIAYDPQEVEEILKTLKTDKASGPGITMPP